MLPQRFWQKVQINKESECWEWQGAKTPKGYPKFEVNGENCTATRVIYTDFYPVVDISDKLIMHLCDNPPCVNPAHLRAGTAKDNSDDMKQKGRERKLPCYGELHGRAKLTDAQVDEIREAFLSGLPQAKIAKRFGVSQPHVHRLCANKARHNLALNKEV